MTVRNPPSSSRHAERDRLSVPFEVPHVSLAEALASLDRALVSACTAEEVRARLLAGPPHTGGGGSGWDGVRRLAIPTVAELGAAHRARSGDLPLLLTAELDRIRSALSLDACEAEALLVLLAAELDPRYASLYAVLQDDLGQPRPTDYLLMVVLAPTAERRAVLRRSLAPGGRLRASALMQPVGTDHPPLRTPWALAPDVRTALLGDGDVAINTATRCRWFGGPAVSCDATVRVIWGAGDGLQEARRLLGDRRAVVVTLPADPEMAETAATAAWRVGICTGATPVLDVTAMHEDARVAVGRAAHRLNQQFGGSLWLVSPSPLAVTVPHFHVEPSPWSRRRRAWHDAVALAGGSLDDQAAGELAAARRLEAADIADVVDVAPSLDLAGLKQALREVGRGTLRHCTRIDPRRSFADLVVRTPTRLALERLVHFIAHRDRVNEELSLGHRYALETGPLVLFSGRSGTGKTLAAEVIAGALHRPLFVVDLSQLLSKYIGESEKHVDQVLREAQQHSAVLLFDEAEALFSSRVEQASSGGEQFGNMMVAYLLQRLDRHQGIVILATNLRSAVDEAFLRRFDAHVEFPLPDAGERERIWDLMLPDHVQRAADVDLSGLASQRLSGGEIAKAGVKAIFLAEQRDGIVTQAVLEEAVSLQLLELGRLSRPANNGTWIDRGHLLRGLVELVEDIVSSYVRQRFLKEVHILHGSPTDRALAGKKPAVSISVFRIAGRARQGGFRAGLIVSAWSHRAEEEHELLGVVHEALSVSSSQTHVAGHKVMLRSQESHDFDMLHRFWSSHDHPVRPCVVLDAEVEDADPDV